MMSIPAAAAIPELAVVSELAAGEPGLELLVLFGSRARGDAGPTSDWDFGYVAGEEFVPEAFLARLVDSLKTERVDLADLDRAGALLRFRAARDGKPVHERTNGTFAEFWLAAVHFWCDAGPLIRAGYEANLASLGP
jgi:predicted nucleotidyltransferase